MRILHSRLRLLQAQKATEEQRSISLREIARQADIPMTTVSGLANNTLHTVSLESLARLCDYFACDIGDMLLLVEQQESASARSPSLKQRRAQSRARGPAQRSKVTPAE